MELFFRVVNASLETFSGLDQLVRPDPASIYLLKVNNTNTRARCETCSKLKVKTLERRLASFWFFIVNFENISHLVLVFILPTLNMQLPAGEGPEDILEMHSSG